MKHVLPITRVLASALLSLTLITACGGGGGSSPSPTPAPGPTTTPTPDPGPAPTPSPSGEIPAGGTSMLDADTTINYNLWSGTTGDVGSATVVDVTGQSFSKAIRINVTNPQGEFWNGQLQYQTQVDTYDGDVMLLQVFFRLVETADETGAGFVTAFLEGPSPTNTKYVTRELSSTGEWQEYLIPVQVTDTLSAGNLNVLFGFGAGAKTQTFDIGGVRLLNYCSSLTLADLPETELTYVGRDPNAEWRAEAAARIEQYRKGDFVVQVLDANDAPVADAMVELEFVRHAYHFGSVIVGSLIMGDGADSDMYRTKVVELFNQSGPENDLKWAPWEGEWGASYNQTTTLAALQWLKDRNFYLRGHVMVWPSKRNLPNLMQGYLPEGDPASADPAAKQVVLDHIDDIASATAAILDEWDVLNEPFDNHYLMDAFGNDVMVDWFNQARLNLPTQKLYINDYSIVSGGGRNFAHQDHYENTIQYLVDNYAEIDGLGLQSHFSSSPTAIPTVYNIIERFATAFPNLAIRSTEFDINTTDESLQADYTRDFLTIFFSHPNTVGVQNWGFWEGAHWSPNAAMYKMDWTEKPNAVAWRQTIYENWWNDFSGTSDAAGEYSGRGFYGTYDLTVTVGGNVITQEVSVTKGADNTFTVNLP